MSRSGDMASCVNDASRSESVSGLAVVWTVAFAGNEAHNPMNTKTNTVTSGPSYLVERLSMGSHCENCLRPFIYATAAIVATVTIVLPTFLPTSADSRPLWWPARYPSCIDREQGLPG
jgi:hypothetical protein